MQHLLNNPDVTRQLLALRRTEVDTELPRRRADLSAVRPPRRVERQPWRHVHRTRR